MRTIDLNADMGELPGATGRASDREMLRYVTSANIACGFHAGDASTMRETAERCLELGVAIGAHPGLPDREGFGRRRLAVGAVEAADMVLYQTGALKALVEAAGGTLKHVKLHGALYHMATEDDALAMAVAQAIARFDGRLALFGLPDSAWSGAASACGLAFVTEGFADRAYLPDGRLMPRDREDAVHGNLDSVADQALALANGGRFGTICLHGDTPGAAEHARMVAETLRYAGIAVHSAG
ncbi:LamB/YcsF family protein [Cohnella suwonensis]|uniref:LamB/YcsF family protein n=1 Tax=Cohnella suwonensis TaxID=696072 RepID=A0ABW0LT29_9BACL